MHTETGLTQWTAHLSHLDEALRGKGLDPVIMRGGMGAKARAAALARLQPEPGQPPVLIVATGPYAGEGFDCPALDTLLPAAPISFKGRLVQYAGRILRPYPGKTTAEIHDYHDTDTSVLASSLGQTHPRLHQPRLPQPPPPPPYTQRPPATRQGDPMLVAGDIGERGFALLTVRWRVLQHVTACPRRIGDIANAALC